MAQSVEEANALAQDGNIEGAIAMLRSVTDANPSDNGAALALGEMLWNAGRDAEAEQTYTALRAKGERKATLELARMAMLNYRLDEARELLDAYRKSLVKGRKKLAEDESGDFEDQLEKISTMLDRVQNIEVIDSVDVDAVEFFRHYPLSSAAGTLGGREMLPDGIASGDMTTAHITESGGRMVWSAPDSAGNYRLYGSSALLGNEWEAPKALGEELAENGDALYPFLMPDGITLYYASDGDDSLGGFDIFQTREGEDGYLQPTNIGMPYNSPFNDYMLAVDEYTGGLVRFRPQPHSRQGDHLHFYSAGNACECGCRQSPACSAGSTFKYRHDAEARCRLFGASSRHSSKCPARRACSPPGVSARHARRQGLYLHVAVPLA